MEIKKSFRGFFYADSPPRLAQAEKIRDQPPSGQRARALGARGTLNLHDFHYSHDIEILSFVCS